MDFITKANSLVKQASCYGRTLNHLQGNVVFSQEFARRYGDDGIMSVALHPGSLTTNLGRHINPIIRRIIVSSFILACIMSLTRI